MASSIIGLFEDEEEEKVTAILCVSIIINQCYLCNVPYLVNPDIWYLNGCRFENFQMGYLGRAVFRYVATLKQKINQFSLLQFNFTADEADDSQATIETSVQFSWYLW